MPNLRVSAHSSNTLDRKDCGPGVRTGQRGRLAMVVSIWNSTIGDRAARWVAAFHFQVFRVN